MDRSDLGPKSGVKEPVYRDVERQQYDWSHWSHKPCAIGSLQTISCRTITAGDSVELDMAAVVRMSELRRYMYMDVVADLFAFFVPHRHVYGVNWTDFIKRGFDEDISLGTDTPAASAQIQCVGYPFSANIAIPRWAVRPYVQIWNAYFHDPSDTAGILAETYLTSLAADTAALDWGINCCHLPRIWNAAIPSTLTSADYSLPLSGGEVNLYELDVLKGRLRTETARDFFGLKYRDVMDHNWDSYVNTDADQRPSLIMRSRQWVSGHDVDGTDDATLGRSTGKGIGIVNLRFPSKFFSEHGSLWIMALFRIPPVYMWEVNYLCTKSNPTYSEIAGDPDVMRRTQPITLNADEVFHGNAVVDLGKTPYGQWHREQPSLTHRKFTTDEGHPFINPGTISSRNQVVYIAHDLYDGMFVSLPLKHIQVHAHLDMQVKSFVPPAESSIFASTN